MLVNPAPRPAIAAGKWLAGTLTAMLTVLVTAGLLLAMFRSIPLQDLGIRFRLGRPELIGTLARAAVCLLIVALQMYLATFASRSRKRRAT